jgi:hypothetical protein
MRCIVRIRLLSNGKFLVKYHIWVQLRDDRLTEPLISRR